MDEHYMRAALQEAKKAFEEDEIPIGSVIVCNDRIIARSYNMTEKLNDFTAHAEMIAYTSASSFLGSKYLSECILYVTIEPCVMCAGAAFWSRISKIVFGAADNKRGYSKCITPLLHPKTKVVSGILENECSALIKEYFLRKR